MDKKWVEEEPLGPCSAADVGGDEQVGKAWNRRFRLPRQADGTVPMLTETYYVALEDPNNQEDRRTFLRRHVEFLLCADSDDPGGTEVWSDCGYGRAPLPWQPTNDDAWRACHAGAAPTTADWDGTVAHGEARVREINLARA